MWEVLFLFYNPDKKGQDSKGQRYFLASDQPKPSVVLEVETFSEPPLKHRSVKVVELSIDGIGEPESIIG